LPKNKSTQLDQVVWNELWESNPNNTIEHVLPQDKSNPGWSHIAETKHKELLHSIGNLCLLSPNLNSEASNNCFDDKKQVYKKANLTHLKDIVSDGDIERNLWDEDAINNRRERLIEFAIDQWQDLQ